MWVSEKNHYALREELSELRREVKMLRQHYGHDQTAVVNFSALEKPIMIARDVHWRDGAPCTVITYSNEKTQLRIVTTDNAHRVLVEQFKEEIEHV